MSVNSNINKTMLFIKGCKFKRQAKQTLTRDLYVDLLYPTKPYGI